MFFTYERETGSILPSEDPGRANFVANRFTTHGPYPAASIGRSHAFVAKLYPVYMTANRPTFWSVVPPCAFT